MVKKIMNTIIIKKWKDRKVGWGYNVFREWKKHSKSIANIIWQLTRCPPWPGCEEVVGVVQQDRLKVGDQVDLVLFGFKLLHFNI